MKQVRDVRCYISEEVDRTKGRWSLPLLSLSVRDATKKQLWKQSPSVVRGAVCICNRNGFDPILLMPDRAIIIGSYPKLQDRGACERAIVTTVGQSELLDYIRTTRILHVGG